MESISEICWENENPEEGVCAELLAHPLLLDIEKCSFVGVFLKTTVNVQ